MTLQERIAATENGLLPRTPVEGDHKTWTLKERMTAYAVPGVSIAVIKDGKIDWSRGYGLCQSDDPGSLVSQNTLFQAASMSKPVCATAALQLVGEGRVDLDLPINAFLSTWSLPASDELDQSPVTLRQILSHTAGLNVHGFEGFEQGAVLPTVYEILDGIAPARTPAVRITYAPGSRYQYSGGGTTIAQLLVMEQRGVDFDTAVQENIFRKLGMTQATFSQPLPATLMPMAAAGHRAGPAVLSGRWRNLPQLGAGGLWVTPTDYARFLIGLRRAWKGGENPILPQDIALDMMRRQGPGPFGLGPRIFGGGNSLRFEHGGSQQGYQCESVCYLESGDGAVVMTNSDLGSPLAFEILNAIASVYGWPGFLRQARRPVELSDEELDAYVGTYRITSGMEAEFIGIRRDGSHLLTMMDFVPDTPILVASKTELFSPMTPYDVRLELGADGRAQTCRVYEEDLLIMEAVRDDDHRDWRPDRRGD
jgi:CubicO group peptidase (beta-lactamase class C family)